VSAEEAPDEGDLLGRIEQLAAESARFRVEAYVWVLRVLEATRERLGRNGHVTGHELLAGNLRLARDEFGPMACEVLGHWGIHESEDLGRLVFTMVEADILHKTENDTVDDFREGYDFRQAFVEEYRW